MTKRKHNPYCHCDAHPSVHRHDTTTRGPYKKRSGKADTGRNGVVPERPVMGAGFWERVRAEGELRDLERKTRR
jgi:hypothetical protein